MMSQSEAPRLQLLVALRNALRLTVWDVEPDVGQNDEHEDTE